MPSRPGSTPLSVLASVVGVTGAATFALAEGAAALLPGAGEPILYAAAIAGMGYVFLKIGGWIVETRDLARETHNGLFNPHTGVFTVLDHHEKRASRHSGEIRAIRDGE